MELDSLKSSEIETLVGAEIRAEALGKVSVCKRTYFLVFAWGEDNYFGLTASELIARAEHALAASTKEGEEQ